MARPYIAFEPVHRVLEILPLYFLILFGCYCLGKLGYDLLVFRDDPQEIDVLAKVFMSE